ncbi:MAG: HAMP domain-containing histidine kinase [Candidatus Pacebacteria bacterium]|nr:HAMP domain-containing histidine kinase [Candidatus Paceibacterota bacterium]
MEPKAPNKTLVLLKNIGYTIGGVIGASIFVTIVGYSGYILTGSLDSIWLYILIIVVGSVLYIVVFLLFRRLRRVEELKSEFLTIAAHNLRTPLTKIQWLINDVSEIIQDKKARSRFQDMQNAFKDLTKIVNRFLEMSEAGQTSIYFSYLFEEQHIEYIILQAISKNKVGIDQKNLALATRIQENLPTLLLDQDRIHLVANILIENAVLYNTQNGSIDIDIYQKKDNIICSIKDTGIGISKDEIPKLFQKFFRSQDAVSIDTDRVGLELALAKEIIEKHDGKIYAESEGKGRGSRFWFTLPVIKKDK